MKRLMVNYRLLNQNRNIEIFEASDSLCVNINRGNVFSKCVWSNSFKVKDSTIGLLLHDL